MTIAEASISIHLKRARGKDGPTINDVVTCFSIAKKGKEITKDSLEKIFNAVRPRFTSISAREEGENSKDGPAITKRLI